MFCGYECCGWHVDIKHQVFQIPKIPSLTLAFVDTGFSVITWCLCSVGSQFISPSSIYHYFAGRNNYNQIYHRAHAVSVISCGGLPPIPPDPSLCVYVGHWVMADFPSHRYHQSMHCPLAKTACLLLSQVFGQWHLSKLQLHEMMCVSQRSIVFISW